MLVLTRKEGESIVIHGRIVVSVIKIHAHRVQVGIDAPKCFDIYRSEVLEAISQEEAREQPAVENRVPEAV